MANISDFFSKIKALYAREIYSREAILQAIQNIVKITIPIDSITIKGRVVTISLNGSTLKSMLYIRKEKILEEINKINPSLKITDIRF